MEIDVPEDEDSSGSVDGGGQGVCLAFSDKRRSDKGTLTSYLLLAIIIFFF